MHFATDLPINMSLKIPPSHPWTLNTSSWVITEALFRVWFYNMDIKFATRVQEGQGRMIHMWTEAKVHHGSLNENLKFPNPPGGLPRASRVSRVYFLIVNINQGATHHWVGL